MQKERVFKKRYAIGLIIIVLVWVTYMLPRWMFPVGLVIYKKAQLNNAATIYIVQSDAGATTAFGYSYYLVDSKKSDADFMAHIDEYTPFLNTKDEKAVLKVEDSQIYLRVQGEIYSFDSPALYRVGSEIYTIGIHLDATP